jgi:environmental stress-induced protein Ves
MQILRASEFRTMPWKNGGGETTEIVVSPLGASMDDFDWRISMARVASDGPFSIFPGIDRSLTLLEGAGMTLDIAGMGPHHLTTISQPLAFPGDVPVQSRLDAGPILDLNVMTRRGICHAVVERLAGGELPLLSGEATLILLVRGGTAMAGAQSLADGDAVLLEPGHEAVALQFAPGTIAFRIAISPASGSVSGL